MSGSDDSTDDRLMAAATVIREAPSASPAALRAIVSATIRLYASTCESAGAEVCPIDRDIPTTEAMMLACALVRSQNLNPFDFALWFSTGR